MESAIAEISVATRRYAQNTPVIVFSYGLGKIVLPVWFVGNEDVPVEIIADKLSLL